MKKLFLLPLEPYVERYTYFMSAKGGWTESWLKKYGVDFVRVEGDALTNEISNGVVLDAAGRSYYSCTQIAKMVKLINDGEVHDGDVIYTEDFWQPGIESLFYIRALTGIRFEIGCFCHAQSVDNSDFTWPMRDWMRPIEIGFGKQYDHIMVCSPILKNLLVVAGVGTEENIHVVGLPYNFERLKEQLAEMCGDKPEYVSLKMACEGHWPFSALKQGYVLFSSRFDDEKDPMFFLDVVEANPSIPFKLVSPRKFLTKNKAVEERAREIASRENSNLEIVSTKNKLDYYNLLAHAAVQFNCAIQDWVSWTLVEACSFGCIPIYPNWKDFPSELHYNPRLIYARRDVEDASSKIKHALMVGVDSQVEKDMASVVKKHDASWRNYLYHMGHNFWPDVEVKK